MNELELPKTCKTEFPDVDDLLNFKLIIYPDEVFIYINKKPDEVKKNPQKITYPDQNHLP